MDFFVENCVITQKHQKLCCYFLSVPPILSLPPSPPAREIKLKMKILMILKKNTTNPPINPSPSPLLPHQGGGRYGREGGLTNERPQTNHVI